VRSSGTCATQRAAVDEPGRKSLGPSGVLPAVALAQAAITVRLAGLPIALLEGLRCHDAARAADTIVALDGWLTEESAALADLLHEVIGEAAPALRPRLIGLRRALFGGRRLAPNVLAETTRAALPAAVASRIQVWQRRFNERDDLRRRLPEQLAVEVARAAASLRQAVSDPTDPGLLLGLAYSNLAMFEDAQRWLAKSDRRPADKTAVRLAKYLARGAAKTSPLTWFGSSGLGSWRLDGPSLALNDPQPRAIAEFGLAALDRVIAGLVLRPSIAGRLRVRVNPTLRIEQDAQAGGPLARFIAPGMMGASRTFRLSPGLCTLLRHIRAGHTIDDLRSLLARNPGGDEAKASRNLDLLAQLLRAGLLERHLPIADQALAPRTVLEWLDQEAAHTPDDPELAAPRALLRDLVHQLERFARAQASEQRVQRHHRIIALAAKLEGAPPASSGDRPPAFYENLVIPGEAMVANVNDWAEPLADLAAAARLAQLHDAGLTVRALLSHFVAERHGRGARIPFLDFYAAYDAERRAEPARPELLVSAVDIDPARAVVRALAGRAAADPALSEVPRMADLVRRRRQITALLDRSTSTQQEAVVVSRDQVDQITAGWVDLAPMPNESLACYVQPFVKDGQTHFVLNTVTFGMGTGRTRVCHLMRQASCAPPAGFVEASHARDGDTGTIHVEIEPVFGSALNQREQAAEFAFSYPGAVSARPPEKLISLADLVVVHDPERDCVRLERIDDPRELRPVHLGLLAAPMLPPPIHFLVAAFGGSSCHVRLPLLTPRERLRESGGGLAAAGRHHWPRLQVGRVVIRRAGWWLPAAEIPRRAGGESDAQYFVRLASWRRKEALPDHCFIRCLRGDAPFGPTVTSGPRAQAAIAAPATPLPWPSKERKPQYIDFASWHLVAVFERAIRDVATGLMIEEVLPDFAHLPATANGVPRVVELIVELPQGKV
jgi:hypothetical protein